MHQYPKMSASRNEAPGIAAVKAAIANFRRQNHIVDEKNDEPVSVYVLLRDTHKRFSGQMLVDYLGSLKMTVSHGDLSTIGYWAVPRVNFPDGLPPHIANAVRPAGTLNHQFPAEDHL